MGLIDSLTGLIYIVALLSFLRFLFKRNVTKRMLTIDVVIVSLGVVVWCLNNLI